MSETVALAIALAEIDRLRAENKELRAKVDGLEAPWQWEFAWAKMVDRAAEKLSVSVPGDV